MSQVAPARPPVSPWRATIAKRVRRQGCKGREVFLLSALLPRFAGRVALACRPTCSCATWTWLLDSRRLEVVADGFWRGAQLALDTTMVSPLRRDGTTRPRSANFDGAALKLLDEERKLFTLSCPVKVGERASLSWQLKWAGGGARRRRNSSPLWRKLEPKRCHPWSCKAGPRELG